MMEAKRIRRRFFWATTFPFCLFSKQRFVAISARQKAWSDTTREIRKALDKNIGL